jgi:hypothetical protein
MRFIKVAILSVSWLVLGCNLFSKSDNNSHGENAPVMYGSGTPGGIGPGGSGGAGASGTKADAAVAGTGGAAGGGFRGDAGPDATRTGGSDASKPPADADIHNGAQRWINFGHYTFTKCTWFSATDGFCSDSPRAAW